MCNESSLARRGHGGISLPRSVPLRGRNVPHRNIDEGVLMTLRDDSKPATILAHAGRDPHHNHGVVNPPVYHASTILFPTVQAMEDAQKRRFFAMTYGRHGTPTTFA